MLKKYNKEKFISSLADNAKILDVGCGNASVINVKKLKPNCIYTGIDISDYAQTTTSKSMMDEYIITTTENFATSIKNIPGEFDAVISSHNLEHTDDREQVLVQMINKVRKNGRIYISFPCAESINFPKREGTLNYFDDNTHKYNPPDFDNIIEVLKNNNFLIEVSTRRYRPLLAFIIGLIYEPLSMYKKKVLRGTWQLYGFESIIHAKKK